MEDIAKCYECKNGTTYSDDHGNAFIEDCTAWDGLEQNIKEAIESDQTKGFKELVEPCKQFDPTLIEKCSYRECKKPINKPSHGWKLFAGTCMGIDPVCSEECKRGMELDDEEYVNKMLEETEAY